MAEPLEIAGVLSESPTGGPTAIGAPEISEAGLVDADRPPIGVAPNDESPSYDEARVDSRVLPRCRSEIKLAHPIADVGKHASLEGADVIDFPQWAGRLWKLDMPIGCRRASPRAKHNRRHGHTRQIWRRFGISVPNLAKSHARRGQRAARRTATGGHLSMDIYRAASWTPRDVRHEGRKSRRRRAHARCTPEATGRRAIEYVTTGVPSTSYGTLCVSSPRR